MLEYIFFTSEEYNIGLHNTSCTSHNVLEFNGDMTKLKKIPTRCESGTEGYRVNAIFLEFLQKRLITFQKLDHYVEYQTG